MSKYHNKKIIPTEYEECKVFAEYLTLKGFYFSHIAQSTFTPHWGIKMKNKMLGVRKGVPDYLILVKGKIVFIEMKKTSGGIISAEQKNWIEALNNCGVIARCCRGAEEAIDFIESLASHN